MTKKPDMKALTGTPRMIVQSERIPTRKTVLQNILAGKYDLYEYQSEAMKVLDRDAIKDTLKNDLEIELGVPHNYPCAVGLFEQAWELAHATCELRYGDNTVDEMGAQSRVDMYQSNCYEEVQQVYESLFRAIVLPMQNFEKSKWTLDYVDLYTRPSNQ